MTNIRVDVNATTITLMWDAPPSNGAEITSYNIEFFQDGQLVDDVTTATTSISVSRNELQDIGDVIRIMNTVYLVEIVAVNGVGSGEKGSETFTIPAGMI